MKPCGCVAVTPLALKLILVLGSLKDGGSDLQHLAGRVEDAEDEVFNVLDDMRDAGVIEVVNTGADTEFYTLSEHGWNLFEAVYEGTKLVTGGD